MSKPRVRAAHLGRFTYQGRPYVATFKAGKLLLRRWHSGRYVAFTLPELLALATGQPPLPGLNERRGV